ncbi:MAG TPA: VOC family protein [Holophagaceae bacterium]|nr:VOC family protein [Holophagaceae bacterium]
MTDPIPFQVRGLDHVVFRVRDLTRMEAFYREALGCEVIKRQEHLGLVHIRAGLSLVDLVSVEGRIGHTGGAAPGREGHNVAHICLRVDPFDAAAIQARMRALGVPCGGPSSNFGAEGEGPSLYLTDPEGNTVELKGPSE